MTNPGPESPRAEHGHGDVSGQISPLITSPLPSGALHENVDEREITGPDQGFGKLWRKHYWIRIDDASVTPQILIDTWRTHYTEFWPKGSHLYQPHGVLREGDVAAADLAMIGGTHVGTGVVVTDVQETSFTLSSLQGHTFCGRITFSGSEDHGSTVAEIVAVLRASDPLYEVGMFLGGHRYENRFWKASLVALARYFGVDAPPGMAMECLDSHRKWRNATSIVHNAFLHTSAYLIAAQVRRLFRPLRSKERAT